MIDLAWLWDDHDRPDADVNLTICTKPGLSPPTARVLLHSVIVASASDYFKKCLTTDVGKIKDSGRNISCADAVLGSKYEVCELMQETQAPAALAVLEMVYKQSLPSETPSVGLLLDMLQVSARWMRPYCVTLCHNALAALKPSTLVLEDLQAIYSTPAALQSSSLLAPVMTLALQALLLLFGDVVKIVASPLLTYQLLLPYAAFLALLDKSSMVTDSENSVLMILSWWLEGVMGQGCDGNGLQALQQAVRYNKLSMTYLMQAVPEFPRLFPGQHKLLDLIDHRHYIMHAASPELVEKSGSVYNIPAGWLQPSRPFADCGCDVDLTLSIPVAELKKHLKVANGWNTTGVNPAPITFTQIFEGLHFSATFDSTPAEQLTVFSTVSLPLPAVNSLCKLRRGVRYNLQVFIFAHQQGPYLRYLGDSRDICSSKGHTFKGLNRMITSKAQETWTCRVQSLIYWMWLHQSSDEVLRLALIRQAHSQLRQMYLKVPQPVCGCHMNLEIADARHSSDSSNLWWHARVCKLLANV